MQQLKQHATICNICVSGISTCNAVTQQFSLRYYQTKQIFCQYYRMHGMVGYFFVLEVRVTCINEGVGILYCVTLSYSIIVVNIFRLLALIEGNLLLTHIIHQYLLTQISPCNPSFLKFGWRFSYHRSYFWKQ